MKDRFVHIYWFVVGLCAFGAGLTIFLIVYLPAEPSQRVADTALIFWLSTAVSGGIGYLIGNSAKNKQGDLTTENATVNAENAIVQKTADPATTATTTTSIE